MYDASQDGVDPLGPLDLEYVFHIGKVGDTDLEDLVHVDTAEKDTEDKACGDDEFLWELGTLLDVGEHLGRRGCSDLMRTNRGNCDPGLTSDMTYP